MHGCSHDLTISRKYRRLREDGEFIWNIHGVYIRVLLVSLHKVWRSITKKVEINDDISGNIMAFLWIQRCFTCRVA